MPPARRSTRTLTPRAAAVLLVLFALVAGLAWWLDGRTASGSQGGTTGTAVSTAGGAATRAAGATGTGAGTVAARSTLITKARYVMGVVDATGQPPDGYVGGRRFMNDERGGTTALPSRDSSGKAITYHEYDVNPHRQGVDRGPQRLVLGSDGSAYVTGDHYVTWQRLR